MTHTVRAVSYTHLDVYKRQQYDKEALREIIAACGLPADVRGERLAIADFAALSWALRQGRQ